MLRVVCLTTLISAIHPLKWCVYFRYRKNCNHPFFEVNVFFYSLYHFSSLAVNDCHLLSLVVICCHSFCHLLSLAVIHCHLLSLVVIRCHSLYHFLPFVVTRCCSLSLVVTRCTCRLSFYKQCVSNRSCLCTLYLTLLFLSTCRYG